MLTPLPTYFHAARRGGAAQRHDRAKLRPRALAASSAPLPAASHRLSRRIASAADLPLRALGVAAPSPERGALRRLAARRRVNAQRPYELRRRILALSCAQTSAEGWMITPHFIARSVHAVAAVRHQPCSPRRRTTSSASAAAGTLPWKSHARPQSVVRAQCWQQPLARKRLADAVVVHVQPAQVVVEHQCLHN